MTTPLGDAQPSESGRLERVRSFFDSPGNYLDRKRFDIRVRAETVATFVGKDSFEHILDVGCGDGTVSLPLLTPYRHLTLVDIAANMLASAERNVPPGLRANVAFRQEDFLGAAFDQSFDLVICMGVLAHVASPWDVIRKAAILLKPGGKLLLECTDSSHVVRRVETLPGRIFRLWRGPNFKVNELSASQVRQMAVRNGFEIRAALRYSWPPPGFQRIFSQNALYTMVRTCFGDAANPRNQWLGFEHILCLSRQGSGPVQQEGGPVTESVD